MKVANETSAFLVDAIYYDITDSAHLEAKWKNRLSGKISTCRGPTPVDFLEQSSRRQMDWAKRFIEENDLLTYLGRVPTRSKTKQLKRNN